MDCGYGPWSSGSSFSAGGGGGGGQAGSGAGGGGGGPAGPATVPCKKFYYDLMSLFHIYGDHVLSGNETNKSKYDFYGFWFESDKPLAVQALNNYVFANSGPPQVQYDSKGKVWSYVYSTRVNTGTVLPINSVTTPAMTVLDVGTLAGKLGGGKTSDATLVLDPNCMVRTSFPGKPLQQTP